MEMHLGEGHGACQSQIEIDPLYAKIEAIAQSNISQGDMEISKLDKLVAEQDIMAARIIQKLNNNSQRILKITSKKSPIAPIISEQASDYRTGTKTAMEVD